MRHTDKERINFLARHKHGLFCPVEICPRLSHRTHHLKKWGTMPVPTTWHKTLRQCIDAMMDREAKK